MIYVEAKQGEYIFQQGDSGNCFFLIEQGSVDVEVDKRLACSLSPGQAFGELALLFRTTRAASIICKGQKNTFMLMKPLLYKQTLQKIKT